MNVGRYILGSIVVFIFLVVIEWLFHTYVLGGWYSQQPGLFRPESQAGSYVIWNLLGFLILAFGFCFIFIKGYENKGIAEGFRYGLYVGIAFSVSASLMNYSVMPIPGKWVIAWIIGYIIIMILAGMIFAALYRPAVASKPVTE